MGRTEVMRAKRLAFKTLVNILIDNANTSLESHTANRRLSLAYKGAAQCCLTFVCFSLRGTYGSGRLQLKWGAICCAGYKIGLWGFSVRPYIDIFKLLKQGDEFINATDFVKDKLNFSHFIFFYFLCLLDRASS